MENKMINSGAKLSENKVLLKQIFMKIHFLI